VIAWGIASWVLCVATGMLIAWPVAYSRGLRHAAEDAEDAATAAVVAGWKSLPDEDTAPAPAAPHTGPGKHRHPAGPRHAALPVAGRLPAEPRRWTGTITVPAPGWQPPSWGTPPPEPQADVLEPTAVLPPVPDPRTDTAWTRDMAADMDRWIAEHITATDSTLKQITDGTR
jgi:hypothetical protein